MLERIIYSFVCYLIDPWMMTIFFSAELCIIFQLRCLWRNISNVRDEFCCFSFASYFAWVPEQFAHCKLFLRFLHSLLSLALSRWLSLEMTRVQYSAITLSFDGFQYTICSYTVNDALESGTLLFVNYLSCAYEMHGSMRYTRTSTQFFDLMDFENAK